MQASFDPIALLYGLKQLDPNAFVGFEIAVFCIENSVIHLDSGNTMKIEHPIFLSNHSYIDIICALSTDKNILPENHYHIYSVFLEQLTYKTNPNCQYDTPQDVYERNQDGEIRPIAYHSGKPYSPTSGDDMTGV